MIKKNILIFSLQYDPYIGGAELFLKELVSRLDCNFTIITRGGPKHLKKVEKKGNITIIRVGKGKYDKYIYPLLAYRKALNLHKKQKFDIVHSIMANHAGLAGMWFKKRTKIPFLLTLQTGQSDKRIKKYLGPFFKYYKKIYTTADKIHSISNFLKKRAIRMGVKENKILVIPNGVDLKLFDRKRFSKKELDNIKDRLDIKNKKLIVTSSRLSKKNGIEYVIRAMKYIEDSVFLILGDGELKKELIELSKKIGVTNKVIFYGSVKNKELPKFLCVGDVFIRPSLSEGQGISFIEAMACKLPVIATKVGGIPDFIENGKTGYFCKVKNSKDTAKVIELVLKKDNKEVIKNAHTLIVKKYNWDYLVKEINQIYGVMKRWKEK